MNHKKQQTHSLNDAALRAALQQLTTVSPRPSADRQFADRVMAEINHRRVRSPRPSLGVRLVRVVQSVWWLWALALSVAIIYRKALIEALLSLSYSLSTFSKPDMQCVDLYALFLALLAVSVVETCRHSRLR